MNNKVELQQSIQDRIASSSVLIFMKGTPSNPLCGFSAAASRLLSQYSHNLEYINILEEPEIRKELPQITDWPTFPQIFIHSEFIGGYDILMSLHKNGSLVDIFKNNMSKK